MAGLLDSIFNTQEGRMGLGLLALGQAPRSQAMPGLLSLMNSMDVAEQRKAESAWANTQRERQQKEWAAKDAAAQRAAQIQAAIPGLFGSTSQGSVSIPEVGGVPFVSQGVQVDQPSIRSNSGFDVPRALQLGMTPEQIQKYAELTNVGRQEVARTVSGQDEQGRPVTYQFDKFGAAVGKPVAEWKAPVSVNQGDRTTFVDAVTLQPRSSFGVNMSAAERDASARGWASNSLARQRLDFDMGGGADVGPNQAGMVRQFGKPPAGYRWKQDGSLETIPGGPTDIKAGAEGVKAEQRRLAAEGSAGNVLSAVSDAKSLVGLNTAGVGSALASIPGTDARDLSAKLETVKANLGFDRLQQMRDMSPTGGALGAVAVQELNALQSTVASLDQGQSRGELTKSLNKIEKHYNNWLRAVNGQQPKAPAQPGSMGSGSWSGGAVPSVPMRGQVIGGYKFKGGNPADQSNWEQVR